MQCSNLLLEVKSTIQYYLLLYILVGDIKGDRLVGEKGVAYFIKTMISIFEAYFCFVWYHRVLERQKDVLCDFIFLDKGLCTNHVDRIQGIFDPPPPL